MDLFKNVCVFIFYIFLILAGVIETSECFNLPIQYTHINECTRDNSSTFDQFIISHSKAVKIETIKFSEEDSDEFYILIIRAYEAFGSSVSNIFKVASNVSHVFLTFFIFLM